MTNAHLAGYQPGGAINITGLKNFDISSYHFSRSPKPGCQIGVMLRVEKLLKCTLADYITILPDRRASRTCKNLLQR